MKVNINSKKVKYQIIGEVVNVDKNLLEQKDGSKEEQKNQLEEVIKLIEKGNINSAIEALSSCSMSQEERDDLIMLKAKFSNYKKEKLLNLISFDEAEVSFARILNYLITLSNKIKE